MEETRDTHNLALGSAIRQLRKRANLSQEELAERAEVSAELLGRIEAGRVDADWGTLRHLAYAMEVDLPEVFRLTEEMLQG